jgi:hypothetical protein
LVARGDHCVESGLGGHQLEHILAVLRLPVVGLGASLAAFGLGVLGRLLLLQGEVDQFGDLGLAVLRRGTQAVNLGTVGAQVGNRAQGIVGLRERVPVGLQPDQFNPASVNGAVPVPVVQLGADCPRQ